jgi:hypothetical protein
MNFEEGLKREFLILRRFKVAISRIIVLIRETRTQAEQYLFIIGLKT